MGPTCRRARSSIPLECWIIFHWRVIVLAYFCVYILLEVLRSTERKENHVPHLGSKVNIHFHAVSYSPASSLIWSRVAWTFVLGIELGGCNIRICFKWLLQNEGKKVWQIMLSFIVIFHGPFQWFLVRQSGVSELVYAHLDYFPSHSGQGQVIHARTKKFTRDC